MRDVRSVSCIAYRVSRVVCCVLCVVCCVLCVVCRWLRAVASGSVVAVRFGVAQYDSDFGVPG